ncbi:glycosyltransferase family 39 protein, partial [Myxococcota bacterium]
MKLPVPRIQALSFLLLSAFFLFFRIWAIRHPLNSDDIHYVQFAEALLDGSHWVFSVPLMKGIPHHCMRLGFIAPLAFLLRVLGEGPVLYYSIPIFASFVGFVLLYRTIRESTSAFTASTAVLVLTVLPQEVLHASRLLTDLPAAVLIILCLVLCERASLAKTASNQIWYALGCGMLIVWGYLIRTNQPILLVPALSVFVLYRESRRPLLVALVVFAVFFAGEQLVYFMRGGGLWYRIKVVGDAVSAYSQYSHLTWGEYFTRNFVFTYETTGIWGVTFLVVSLVCHPIAFFTNRSRLLRSVLLSGLATFVLFRFYIFAIEPGGVKAQVMNHRFVQLFNYSSVAAVFSVLYLLGKMKLQKVIRVGGFALRTERFPMVVAATLLCVGFGCVVLGDTERLSSSRNEYRALLEQLERTQASLAPLPLKVMGSQNGLNAVRMVNSNPDIEFEYGGDYQGIIDGIVSGDYEYFLTDKHREICRMRFARPHVIQGVVEFFQQRNRELNHNFRPIFENDKFHLFRRRDPRFSEQLALPGLEVGENGEIVDVSWRWLHGTACTSLPIDTGGTTISCHGTGGADYLFAGESGDFREPPPVDLFPIIEGNAQYLIELEHRNREGPLGVELWFVEYGKERNKHKAHTVNMEYHGMWVRTSPNTNTFRVLLRFYGR